MCFQLRSNRNYSFGNHHHPYGGEAGKARDSGLAAIIRMGGEAHVEFYTAPRFYRSAWNSNEWGQALWAN
jgi:hypothetical protein